MTLRRQRGTSTANLEHELSDMLQKKMIFFFARISKSACISARIFEMVLRCPVSTIVFCSTEPTM